MNDTICALATPAGGAIGIIRVSGDKAIRITDELFKAKSMKSLSDAKGNSLHYGEFYNAKQQLIDEVVISVYKAPHSYTGEDSTEISCHGSAYILHQVMQALIDKGCRSAQPGEYTQRAYLNGKMDLSQAEAVADLVSASNKASHQLALSQIRGHFSNELSKLRDMLLHITSLLELELDFSDHEELEFADRGELRNLAETIHQRIVSLTKSFETGKAVKKGVPVAIVGKTNVGKSTLLNCLLHEEKAIVSNIHGTTRDVIEDTTEIKGITFRFIDTAGLRHTEDTIEQLGIERTYKKLNEATIILWVVEQSPTTEELKEMENHTQGKQRIIVKNKVDLNPQKEKVLPPIDIAISAKHQQNIHELEQYIFQAAHLPEINESSVILTNARHYEALTRADEMILRVIDGIESELSGDLISEDLRTCLNQLAEITGGQITPNEVLGNIFKHFCIGK